MFALLGGCTCFGLYGSGVAYLTAPSPLGPYTLRSSKLDPGCDISATASCYDTGHGKTCMPVLGAQQNDVIEYIAADNSTQYIWTGDRWQTAPHHVFGEDPQTWAPLEFDDEEDPPRIRPMRWRDSFTIDLLVE